jgi:peptide/nickel transport system permease protein
VITLVAVFAPWLTPFDPYVRVGADYEAPSGTHWFGTDDVGRDLLSRIVLGVQFTWLPALAVILASLVVGTAVGLIAGALGGKVDLVLQRVVELFILMPSAIVALALVAALGPGLANIMIAVGVFWWPWYARMARDEVHRVMARPHVEAARIAGVRGPRLLFRYLLPGAVPSLLVAATLDVSNIVTTISLMSFLGLGQPAPAPELGAMMARTLDSFTVYWWLPILPGVALLLMCLLANLAGDGLRASLRGA